MITGKQYLDSLHDGRRTYIEGRRIDDLATEPTTKVAVAAVAAGYDHFYREGDEARNPLLTPPRSAEELREIVGLLRGVDMLAHTTFTSVMTLLTVAPTLAQSHPELAERIYAHCEKVRREDLRVTECITDAKGHRALPPGKQEDPDVYVRVVERRDDGVVIRGAKLHITGASLAHELFVMPTKRMKPGEEDYSIACAVPVNAPGVRPSTRPSRPRPEDDRASSRCRGKQMPEGFVIFDDVFVPNERIFLDGEVSSRPPSPTRSASGSGSAASAVGR